MLLIIAQIFGAAVLIFLLFLSIFLFRKHLRIRKRYTVSPPPALDNYEKILSESFRKSFIKDYEGAIKDINQALKLKPYMEKLYFQRAKIKEEMKDYQGAKADYTKAILLKADYDLAFLNRGLLKIKLQDYTGARRDLNKALELNSSLSEAQFFKHEAELKVKQIRKENPEQIKIDFQEDSNLRQSKIS